MTNIEFKLASGENVPIGKMALYFTLLDDDMVLCRDYSNILVSATPIHRNTWYKYTEPLPTHTNKFIIRNMWEVSSQINAKGCELDRVTRFINDNMGIICDPLGWDIHNSNKYKVICKLTKTLRTKFDIYD